MEDMIEYSELFISAAMAMSVYSCENGRRENATVAYNHT